MKYILIFISLIVFSTSLNSREDNSAAEYVFLINIDGIRNNEAFEWGNQLLRYLWDSLRPNGTIYTNFYNTGVTVTNSGHSTLVTGVRQTLPNNVFFRTLIRPVEPGIGEYMIKYLSVPYDKVFYISGKHSIWTHPVSMYPGFGEPYSPSIVLADDYDTVTYRKANEVIDNYHPKFAYILFAQIDEMGHLYDKHLYHKAILQADSLTYMLWKKVQADPVYSGKITFIITTDHGRHDKNHGDWQNHGDHCHGCRHIPLLAIGPNIKANNVETVFREQIDVAPTIAHMFGFTMPFSQGNIMTEMFSSYQPLYEKNEIKQCDSDPEINISNSPGYSRSPSVSSSGEYVHVVYSNNSSGKWDIYYTKSSNSGLNWSLPAALFSTESGQDLEPAINCSGENVFAAVTGYKHYIADSTYIWILHSKTSSDNGNTWSQDNFIDTLTTISSKPSISVNSNRLSIGAQRYYTIYDYTSLNGGTSFNRYAVYTNIYSLYPSVALFDTTRYFAWQSIRMYNSPMWNIYFKKQPYSSSSVRLTNNDSNTYSYFPKVCSTPGNIHLVFGSLINSPTGNNWNVQYSRYSISSNNWKKAVIISGSRNAYKPLIKVSGNGKIIVIWNDYETDLYSVWGVYSTDNGSSWSDPFRVTQGQEFSCNLDFSVSDDTLFVTRQSLRSGKWEIFFSKYVIGSTIGINSETENVSDFELMQNYPNPFNPVTKIRFSVPTNVKPKGRRETSDVKIILYDILGREVATLVNENLHTGTYEVDFDGTNYPSGVYYYTITYGEFKQTKKMVLIK